MMTKEFIIGCMNVVPNEDKITKQIKNRTRFVYRNRKGKRAYMKYKDPLAPKRLWYEGYSIYRCHVREFKYLYN